MGNRGYTNDLIVMTSRLVPNSSFFHHKYIVFLTKYKVNPVRSLARATMARVLRRLAKDLG